MKFKRQNKTFGLDVGQNASRLVVLERKGQRMVVTRAEEFNIAMEGILDDTELYSDSGLGKWLKELKLEKAKFTLGLPQYLCTTRIVNDFAPNAKQEAMEQMVNYETMQLAGLSEDTFLSDYQTMPPAFEVPNPVIIGFCREMLSNEMYDKADKVPMEIDDLTMDAMALVNCFSYLHPEANVVDALQLLIDIGMENSTIVIMAHGNVLYTGSLMFGAKRFTQVLAVVENCSEEEAELKKPGYVPNWDDEDSPFLLAARQLEQELRTAIENWRAGERESLANEMVSHIWLSGGGAKTIGLDEYLKRTYGCLVEVYGPTIPATEAKPIDSAPAPAEDPAFATAFGLALQTSGDAAISLSLAPSFIRWKRRKLDRLKYLRTAAVLFFITLFASIVYADCWLTNKMAELNDGMDELRKCDQLVPKLDTALEQIEYQQRMLLPFVEMGGRSKVFLKTIENVQNAMEPGEFCFYFADEFSYRDLQKEKQEEPQPEARPAPTDMFGTPALQPEPVEAVDKNRVNIQTMPLLTSMIIGGFTPVTNNKRYAGVVRLQGKLRENPAFIDDKVDTVVEEWQGRGLHASLGWNQFLKPQRATIGEYTEYKLVLPLAEKLVDIPKVAPKPNKKSKKK
ncbi:MAG: pilus assembly protein PilM [Victivallales bacterium]|nr:pilus assembly protein PilM [Victivallales bacterium]